MISNRSLLGLSMIYLLLATFIAGSLHSRQSLSILCLFAIFGASWRRKQAGCTERSLLPVSSASGLHGSCAGVIPRQILDVFSEPSIANEQMRLGVQLAHGPDTRSCICWEPGGFRRQRSRWGKSGAINSSRSRHALIRPETHFYVKFQVSNAQSQRE